MEKLVSLNEVKEIIASQSIVLLYIGQKNCSVCHSLKPQVTSIMNDFENVTLIELDTAETPMVAEAFDVLTVPVMLLFVEGKEYLRRARMINTNDFKRDVSKIIYSYQEMNQNNQR